MKGRHRALFEALLRIFPSPFRERFGDGMRDAFEVRYREHQGEGDRRMRRAVFLLRTAADMVRSGIRERLRPTLRNEQSREHARRAIVASRHKISSKAAPPKWL